MTERKADLGRNDAESDSYTHNVMLLVSGFWILDKLGFANDGSGSRIVPSSTRSH